MMCAVVSVVFFAGGARMHASRLEVTRDQLFWCNATSPEIHRSPRPLVHYTRHFTNTKKPDIFTHPIRISLHSLQRL
jgi:hypothetical protein